MILLNLIPTWGKIVIIIILLILFFVVFGKDIVLWFKKNKDEIAEDINNDDFGRK
jgi:transposase